MGDDSSGAPWARANKRCQNYATCDDGTSTTASSGTANANNAVMAAIQAGWDAATANDATAAATALSDLEDNAMVVYYQASLRYAYFIDNDLSSSPPLATADHQGEGGAFWRLIAPVLAAKDPIISTWVTDMYTMTSTPTGTDAHRYCVTKYLLDNHLYGSTTSSDYGSLTAASGVTCVNGLQVSPLVGSGITSPAPALLTACNASAQVKLALSALSSSSWTGVDAVYVGSTLEVRLANAPHRCRRPSLPTHAA